jgi:hypothetical protein
LRFRLREALRPLELARLLSLGALVEESLSTRLDSVRAPDRLCVDEDLLRLEPDEERLDPDDRPRELALERLFDEEERLFDFDEEFDFEEDPLAPPERLLLPLDRELRLLLLLDRELPWGILPWLLLDRSVCVRRLPESHRSTRKNPTVQARPEPAVQTSAQRVMQINRRREKCCWHGKPREARNNGADNAILEQKLIARQLEDEEIDE